MTRPEWNWTMDSAAALGLLFGTLLKIAQAFATLGVFGLDRLP